MPQIRRLMKRRTVGRFMAFLVPLAIALWLVRPAVALLVIQGVGSHSHPPAPADLEGLPLGWCPYGRLQLSSRRHDIHQDPFWPQYFRSLFGRSWPGDYACALVPKGTVEERPPWRGEMVSADQY
jgi:hypothetical protein